MTFLAEEAPSDVKDADSLGGDADQVGNHVALNSRG